MNANIVKSTFAFLLAISAGIVSAAQGDVFTWTGAEDNYWTNKNNWAEGKIPNGMSKAIFDPGEGKTIYINMRNRGWGSTSTWPNVYEFKSGNVYFSTYIRYTGNGNTSPGVFYVAEGAKAVISNELFTANGSACMKKTGKGDLICVGKFAVNAAIPQVTVEEGLFRYIQGDSYSLKNVNRVTIKSGATFYPSGGGATLGDGNLVIAIENGGVFKASCGGYNYPNTIDHLEGEGTVEQAGSYDYGLKIKGTTAGEAFSGNFSGNIQVNFMPSDKPMIIGGTETLSTLNLCTLSDNVRFLPSEKPYVISSLRLNETGGKYTALDTNGNPVSVKVKSRVTISGTDMELAFDKLYTPEYYGFYWGADNCAITITKGLYCRTPSVLKNIDTTRKLPAPEGMVMRVGHNGSKITMMGGELWLKTSDSECQMPKVFDHFGGDLAFFGANAKGICKDATPLSPAVLNLRGGRILVDMHDMYQYGTTLFPNTNAFRVVVHEKPAVFKAVNHTASSGEDRIITIARPVESGMNEGKDGGLTIEGGTVFEFPRPVLLNGPFTALDGEILLDNKSDTETTASFFGTGDVNFGNVKFRFPDNPASSKTVKFATDEGASFCVKGASQFTFKKSSSALSQNVEIGGDLVRTRGGVLFLAEHGCAGGFQSTFKVNGGVELNEALLTKTPILFRDPSALKHRFATCAEDARIVPLTDVATSLNDADGKKAVVLSSAAELSAGEEKSVAALMIDDVKLKLNAGSKINVGVGDDPAFVVWNKTYTGGKLPEGSGTVDFGAREGVVVIDSRISDYATFPLPFTLAGSGGITFISAPEKEYKYLKLTGSNIYTGPTVINSIRVEPCTSSAFGSGEVHVGGGERAGGRVYFGTPVTLANDFFVSGRGINKSVYSETSGAFVFAADVTLTGDITLEGETRMALVSSARGTLSGSVKGGGFLSLYPGSGTLVLSGENTYTGGTEVVSATLAVTRTGSLGSGEVVLDNGTLAFENTTAISLTNTVSGVGTVALKGSAPVTFRCEKSSLTAALDLCGTEQTFTEMPPFGTITNSLPKKATIALAANLGTVDWPEVELGGRISLAVGEGTVLDLGGRTVDVFRLEIDTASRVVNGTVNEERPIGGMSIIVK